MVSITIMMVVGLLLLLRLLWFRLRLLRHVRFPLRLQYLLWLLRLLRLLMVLPLDVFPLSVAILVLSELPRRLFFSGPILQCRIDIIHSTCHRRRPCNCPWPH